jgi:4-amino-4-deoxy-L-arabinose transferase-like glycosyltransferase
MSRPLPNLRRRFRENRDEVIGDGALEAAYGLDFLDHPGVALAVGAGALLLFVVLLPLIGIALELIFLLILLWSGIVGRVVLRRPWIVTAVNLDHPERSSDFAVKGWQRSGKAIEEIATAITAGGQPPDRVSGGLPIGSSDLAGA